MKKDTYYFSHDYTARTDHKILMMRMDLGLEGYGIYWFVVEQLAESGGVLPLKIIPMLAKQGDVTLVKMQGVIENYDLFKVEGDKFYSKRLIEHFEIRKALTKTRSIAGKTGAKARWDKQKEIDSQ